MGSEYPMFLEKIVFIGLLIGSIFVGNMLSDHLSGVQLWLSWICGIYLIANCYRIFGRIIQSIHAK